MSSRRRVVITGVGAVSAAGRGAEPLWRACVEGRSMLRPILRFDASDYGSPRAGEVPADTFRVTDGDEPAAALALQAARESLEDAGLDASALPAGSGAALGTCLGGAEAVFQDEPPSHLPVSARALSGPTVRLGEACGLTGPLVTLSTACASGTAAIALGADCVRRGEADVMLAGGVDLLSRFVVSGFWLLRALASEKARPFDRRRDGLALGEGTGILVLEERDRALRRGAPVLAEILGSGSSGDANHMTGPSPTGDGLVRAIRAALRNAGRSPEAVQFISAHGTGTPYNDRMETIAIKRVFGEHAHRTPVNSIKPIIGHTLGAAGALEAIVCVESMREGILPPTINYEEPDPECDLDYVPNVARAHAVRCALSCSSAFGGNNAALLLGLP